MTTDLKKFQNLWCMNEEICKKLLVDDIVGTQKVIFEQQLGLEWKPYDL